MSDSEDKFFEKTEKNAKIIIHLALAFAVTILILYFYKFHYGLSNETGTWGEFGDFIGGTLNPFFSALSLLAILWTLIIQSKELSHSTEALREQSKHLDTQSFENTFFALIQLNNEIAKTLDLSEIESENYKPGRGSFRNLVNLLKETYLWVKDYESQGLTSIQTIRESYKQFYAKNQKFVGNYLKTTEKIMQFIIERCPTTDRTDPATYIDILRAQKTNHELVIIFYHSIYTSGCLSYKELTKRNFFQGISEESLIDPLLHHELIKGNEDEL
ncbi:putative phage abortive infection protein [Pseudomonas oryzihabitans]|uniref:Phage abortive infection protein n=1 Tax=Pseudomonas oryzihabitans TaxID=47885 RepID=A0A1G5P0I8_9PSED|nr:putative phage abortive infection protein [Pseudomonas psychrotolerans]NMY91217.1 hypothetical protein [Pseudomonas psychrotolerans]SCZ43066.1 Putative phage abortive infection protein [Pseudomonas psychrotolerans]